MGTVAEEEHAGNAALPPVVVLIAYQTEWYGSPEGFSAEVAALEALDPRVRVVVSPYVEPHEVKVAKELGQLPPEGFRSEVGPELAEAFSAAQVILTLDLPTDIVDRAPHLRWVQSIGAGTGQLGVEHLAAAGIVVTSNGGANGVGIAEFVVGRVLAWLKRFDEIDALSAEHRWDPRYGSEAWGKTVGLIGYGGINRQVARRAAAFGMRILALRMTTGAPPEPPVERYYGPGDLHQLLAESDVVVSAVPDTPATRQLFDEATFAAMRPGSYFVNVGRGTLVDEPALTRALESGHLAGAALDVAGQEPLAPDDPLWDAPRLAISAHCSSAPLGMFPHVHQNLRDNLVRYLAGQPLADVVRPDRGY